MTLGLNRPLLTRQLNKDYERTRGGKSKEDFGPLQDNRQRAWPADRTGPLAGGCYFIPSAAPPVWPAIKYRITVFCYWQADLLNKDTIARVRGKVRLTGFLLMSSAARKYPQGLSLVVVRRERVVGVVGGVGQSRNNWWWPGRLQENKPWSCERVSKPSIWCNAYLPCFANQSCRVHTLFLWRFLSFTSSSLAVIDFLTCLGIFIPASID
ncbi:hypothetical protein RRG08_067288 [Elysia crispata]|uniref:Uncharacterized protein n=1 Tax=Elysia crispata TaxID=231223 RepID=A0AAE0ZBE0_9GAST|nr:hypothetical protein RRG08_067288 [Elysia crispata]